MGEQLSRSKGKERGSSTTLPRVTNVGGGYNPQMQGEITVAENINMGPERSGNMRFNLPNTGGGEYNPQRRGKIEAEKIIMDPAVDKSITQPLDRTKNHQTGGDDYNPQIQGTIKAVKINMGPSDSGDMDFRNQSSRSKGKERDKNTTQPQGQVTNIQTGGGGYNPQIQGEITEAEKINMGPERSGNMCFNSANGRTTLRQDHDTNIQTGQGGYDPQMQGQIKAKKIRMDPMANAQTPNDSGTQSTKRQTGGGDYNPQIQGKIEAGEINMGPSGRGPRGRGDVIFGSQNIEALKQQQRNKK